jgi:purine-binding chemotaxis protein CheW
VSRVLVFDVAGERYSLPAETVAEVAWHPEVRPLPGMAAHCAGVMRRRGRWLAAVDGARLLGRGADSACVAALIVRRGQLRYALLVEGVEGVRVVEEHDLSQLAGADVLTDESGVITPIAPETLFRNELPPGWEEEMTRSRTAELADPIVIFRVGSSEFGLDVGQVLEVLPYEPPRRVPRAPAFLEGIIQLRGAVVPVVDLRRRFELEQQIDDLETRILITGAEEARIGLVVDRVTDVLRLPRTAFSDAPAYFRGLAAEYLGAIARAGDRLIMVLQLDRVLTSEERIQLREAGLEEESGAVPG